MAETLWVRISVIEETRRVHRHGRWLRIETRKTSALKKLLEVIRGMGGVDHIQQGGSKIVTL